MYDAYRSKSRNLPIKHISGEYGYYLSFLRSMPLCCLPCKDGLLNKINRFIVDKTSCFQLHSVQPNAIQCYAPVVIEYSILHNISITDKTLRLLRRYACFTEALTELRSGAAEAISEKTEAS